MNMFFCANGFGPKKKAAVLQRERQARAERILAAEQARGWLNQLMDTPREKGLATRLSGKRRNRLLFFQGLTFQRFLWYGLCKHACGNATTSKCRRIQVRGWRCGVADAAARH
jgi:hypothetical protein